jgi:hypothetical protein
MFLKVSEPDEDAECYLTNKEYDKVVASLRKVFSQSIFAKKFRHSKLSEEKGPRGGARYNCDDCHQPFEAKETQIHHRKEIVEIGKHSWDYTLNEILARLFCKFKDMLLLCKPCHYNNYTKPQNLERKRLRDLKKEEHL